MSDVPKDAPGPAASLGKPGFSAHISAVACSHDRIAFEALFQHFAPRLKTYFFRSGMTNAAEAEEMAQETMLLVWRKAALFDPGKGGAETWIFAIARNLRADARRRGLRSVAVVGSGPKAVARIPDPNLGADEMVSSAQYEVGLRQALHTLPQEQLQVLELAYFEDRSHADVARGLGIPLGTVKSRLRLALVRLRATLSGEEVS
jgi:RNA polymerase sigma-70 factor (ECF subfamily)